MDYAKSFTFAFEEEGWFKKLGVASLYFVLGTILFVIPGVMFLFGYLLKTARNVIDGKKQVLPDNDNVGEMFADGAKAFIATFVYALPIFLVYAIMLPTLIAGAAAAESGSDGLGGALGFIGVLGYCVVIIYGLFLGLIQPAILVEYLRGGSTIGAALKFGNVIATFRENFTTCLLYFLILIGVNFVVQIVTGISVITICGPIFVILLGTVWSYAVQGHLIGQFYNQVEGGSFTEKSPEEFSY